MDATARGGISAVSIIRLPNVSMEREACLGDGTGLRGNEVEVRDAQRSHETNLEPIRTHHPKLKRSDFSGPGPENLVARLDGNG